mmetsp:Transcript_42713/g.129770  ORF Transcript_42713/g.129770 Transcript_42713/m.129770 type:complete len:314 (-) Transcript_42713:531-1472(-)
MDMRPRAPFSTILSTFLGTVSVHAYSELFSLFILLLSQLLRLINLPLQSSPKIKSLCLILCQQIACQARHCRHWRFLLHSPHHVMVCHGRPLPFLRWRQNYHKRVQTPQASGHPRFPPGGLLQVDVRNVDYSRRGIRRSGRPGVRERSGRHSDRAAQDRLDALRDPVHVRVRRPSPLEFFQAGPSAGDVHGSDLGEREIAGRRHGRHIPARNAGSVQGRDALSRPRRRRRPAPLHARTRGDRAGVPNVRAAQAHGREHRRGGRRDRRVFRGGTFRHRPPGASVGHRRPSTEVVHAQPQHHQPPCHGHRQHGRC